MKTLGSGVLVLVGIIAFVISFTVPTTLCTSTQVNGETVEQRCETNEELRNRLLAAMGFGLISFVSGIIGVRRSYGSAGRVTNIVVGGLLILIGSYIAYSFGGWFLNLVLGSMAGTGLIALLVLVIVAGAGGGIAILGIQQIRNAL